MKCPNCGKEIPRGIQYYTCSCGKKIKIVSKQEQRQYSRYNSNGNISLNYEKGVTTCKCFECGYYGPMPIMQYDHGVFERIILPILIACASSAIGIQIINISFFFSCLIDIGGFVLAYYVYRHNKGKTVQCPNCRRILHTIDYKP